jgi:RNA-binding protein
MPSRSELRKKGVELKPTLQVGKTGFSDQIRAELRSQLENRELVKIRILRSLGPSDYWKEDMISTISEINAELVEIKGNTVLVYKRSSKSLHSRSISSK